MFAELPVRTDIPAYEFQTDLGGTTYTLSFEWTQRSESWHMSILTAEGEPILMGIRLVGDYPLLARYRDDRLPPGEILCIDTTGQGRAPDKENFGTTVLLVFTDEVEDAA